MRNVLLFFFLLAAGFFIVSDARAQNTKQDCFKTRSEESYQCLLKNTACLNDCLDKSTSQESLAECHKNICETANKTCNDQVEAGYRVCLDALPDSNKADESARDGDSSPTQSDIDCRKTYDTEDYKCFGVFNDCQEVCTEKEGRDAASLEVDGAKVYQECMKVSGCHEKSSACHNQAQEDYYACLDALSGDVSKTDSEKTGETGKNLLDLTFGGFPVFIGDWFEMVSTGISGLEYLEVMSNLGELAMTDPEIALWEEEREQRREQREEEAFERRMKAQGYASKEEINEIFNRQPTLREVLDYDSGAWEKDNLYRLDILNGEASIKYPGETEWKELTAGTKIPPGSKIFTGMDTTSVMRIKDKGVVQILPFTEISINERGLEEAAREGQTTTEIKINTGDIEVSVEGGVFAPTLQVTSPAYTAGVRGTHFWASYDKDAGYSVIGVYEGKVEVKTNSGKTYLVSPAGDKPGVLMLTRKISLVRLAIVTTVVLAVVAAIMLIIKKRRLPKSSKRKSRT